MMSAEGFPIGPRLHVEPANSEAKKGIEK